MRLVIASMEDDGIAADVLRDAFKNLTTKAEQYLQENK